MLSAALALLALSGVVAGAPLAAAAGALGLIALFATAFLSEARLRALTQAARGAAARPLPPPVTTAVGETVRLSTRFALPWALGPDPRAPGALHMATPGSLRAAGPVTAAALPDGGLEVTALVEAGRVGRAALDGFLLTGPMAGQLFEVSVPLPAWLRVEALPRAHPGALVPAMGGGDRPSPGASESPSLRMRGSGQALHELRDYVPGDPWKLIAWKATARRGRLAVRELEADTRLSALLLVDLSPSMFWGEPGRAPIDAALAHAARLAASLAERQEPCGLVLFDHAVRAHVPLGLGRAHLARIIRTLAGATTLYAEDRTELTQTELVDALAAWFQRHRARDLRLPAGAVEGRDPRRSVHDEAAVLAACESLLAELDRDGSAARRAAAEPLSAQSDRALLRRFAGALGLPLPLERTNHPGGPARGLLAALEATTRLDSARDAGRGTASRHRGGSLVLALSDLGGVDPSGPERRELRLIARQLRTHRQQLLLLTPPEAQLTIRGTDDTPAQADRLAELLLLAERRADAPRLAAIQAALASAGVAHASLGEPGAVARAFERLRAAS